MKKYVFFLTNKISKLLSNKSLGRIPGLIKVESFLYKIASTNGLLLIEVQNNKMYINVEDVGMSPTLLRLGVYEEYETEIFKNLIKNDTTFIDVGANVGYYTLIATNLIKKGKIYSFEPEKFNYELLNKNILLNNSKNVKTFQKAVSNEEGIIRIYIDEKNVGGHSLAKNNILEDNIISKDVGFFDVKTITLDSFFNNLDGSITDNIIIKMDTQGAEGLVIDGAKNLLLKNNVKILMEFWPKGLRNMGTDPLELLNKLDGYGFEIRLLDEKAKSLKNINKKDIIEFLDDPKEKIEELNLLLEKGN